MSAPGQFDAERAKARLARILGDQRPHPADSAADDRVRARLLRATPPLGLQPIVRDQFACNELYKQRGVACARVRNVIARSARERQGAAPQRPLRQHAGRPRARRDDGAGVATLLEVALDPEERPLSGPVILLFNEGEELGLVGARAFLADPLAATSTASSTLRRAGRPARSHVRNQPAQRPRRSPLSGGRRGSASPIRWRPTSTA